MRKLILLSTCVGICGMVPGTAVAKAKTAATCDAKYYSYLVGKDVTETRTITGADYRVLPLGSPGGEAQPGRLTIFYDKGSNQIVEVACG
jgi:hypothetical protein